MLHILLHFVVPLLVALVYDKQRWFKIWLLMCATMLVDLDHLLATPIYDANRCSINFHPLHSYWMIGLYAMMLIPKKVRVVVMGLLIHMALDWQDCLYKLSF